MTNKSGILDVVRLLCLPSVYLALYVCDILTDALVAHSYSLRDGYGCYAIWTLVLIVIPTFAFHLVCVIWMCSPKQNYWNFQSSSVAVKFFKLIIMFLCAPIIIQAERLSAGWNFIISKNNKKTKKEALSKIADNLDTVETFCGFSFLECCLQSAPQLVLQLIIMIKTSSIEALVLTSCLVSLFSFGYNSTIYKTRQKNSNDLRTSIWWLGVAVYLMYKFLTLLSRAISLALLFDIGTTAFVITLSMHLIVVWAWNLVLYTAENKKKDWLSYAWSFIDGLPLMFTYHGGGKHIRSKWFPHEQRWRMFIFYSIIIVENFASSYIWYNSGDSVENFQALPEADRNATVPISYNDTTDLYDVAWGSGSVTLSVLFTNLLAFGFGISCMVAYYRYLHPYDEVKVSEDDGSKPDEEGDCDDSNEPFENDTVPKMSRYPLMFQKPTVFIKPPEPHLDAEAPAPVDDNRIEVPGKSDLVTKLGKRGPLTELNTKTATELNKKDETIHLTKLTSREERTVSMHDIDDNSENIAANATSLPAVQIISSPSSSPDENHKDNSTNASNNNKLTGKEEEKVPLTESNE